MADDLFNKFVRSSTNVLNKSSAIQNQLSNTEQSKSLVLSEIPIPTFSRTLPGKLSPLSGAVQSFQKTAFLKLTTTAMTINHYPIPFISYLNSEFEDKIKCKKAITKIHFKSIQKTIFLNPLRGMGMYVGIHIL